MAPILAASESDVLIQNDYLSQGVQIVAMVLMFVFTWLGKMAISKAKAKGMDEAVVDELATQITALYHSTVKDLKAKAADGKLTKDEARQLRNKAFENTKEALKSSSLKKHLIKKGQAWVTGKIEDIISAKKQK